MGELVKPPDAGNEKTTSIKLSFDDFLALALAFGKAANAQLDDSREQSAGLARAGMLAVEAGSQSYEWPAGDDGRLDLLAKRLAHVGVTQDGFPVTIDLPS